jgi:type IV secretory pathway VirB6-like protein
MKKFLLLITLVFIFCLFSKANALHDKVRNQNYYKDQAGNFRCDVAGLNPLPYWSGGLKVLDSLGGDMSFETSNVFCKSYAGLYVVSTLLILAAQASGKLTASLIIAEVVVLTAHFGSIFSVAATNFQNVRVCGSDWFVWGYEDDSLDMGGIKSPKVEYPVLGAFKGSYKAYIENCLKDKTKCKPADINNLTREGRNYFNINDKIYREYIYQGKEFQNHSCQDTREKRKYFDVGGTGQLYYTRGYLPANYACDRFLNKKDEYQCCLEASYNSICLTNNYTKRSKFCKGPEVNVISLVDVIGNYQYSPTFWNNTRHDTLGNLCGLADGIVYQIYRGNDNNKICAKTWSLCPYNHNISGGTEIAEYYTNTYDFKTEKLKGDCVDEDGYITSCNNQVKNFCQLNKHCTISIPWQDTSRKHLNISPYFDKACINMIGSSHNTRGFQTYNGYNFLRETFQGYKVFTAPLAECFTESMKNFLFNRAGHAKCLAVDMMPNENDECEDGLYLYQRNQNFNDQDESITYISPVIKLQRALKNIVRMALTFVLVIFGVKTIMAGSIKVKDILNLLIKIVVVWTFASSGWWYDQMFRFVYGASSTFSNIIGNIVTNQTRYTMHDYLNTDLGLIVEEKDIKSDGCYFGYNPIVDNNYKSYGNRNYLAIFDMLDCKIAIYTVYVSRYGIPIIELLLFFVSLLILLLFLSFAVKIVYIFIMSGFALATLLFISPIIIPMILFDKTEGVFQSWLNNIMSFILQPIILFAYVVFTVTILDQYVYGEALFIGKSPKKITICTKYCKSSETNEILKIYANVTDNVTDCIEKGNEIVDITNRSYLCFIYKLARDIKPFFTRVWWGGAFPNLFMSLKVLFLIFIFDKIINRIPNLAANLTGGKALPGMENMYGVEQLFGKVLDAGKIILSSARGVIAGILDSIPRSSKSPSKKEDKDSGGEGIKIKKDNNN